MSRVYHYYLHGTDDLEDDASSEEDQGDAEEESSLYDSDIEVEGSFPATPATQSKRKGGAPIFVWLSHSVLFFWYMYSM